MTDPNDPDDPASAGRLRSELKQERPFRSPEEEAFLNVFRTCAVLVGALVDALREHGVSQPQYNVLRILRGAGPAGLPSGEVSERMVSRDPDVTRLIDRMEARGWVERQRGTADRRVVIVRLTDAGRALTDSLDAPIDALHARTLGHMSADELRSLSDLLERARGWSPDP
jgi:DNA-binding MarR family transcriptional regulator